LTLAIVEIRQRMASTAKEIIVPMETDLNLGNIKFTIPQRGEKKQLLDLSERNAKFYMIEKRKQHESSKPESKVDRILGTVMKDLDLRKACSYRML